MSYFDEVDDPLKKMIDEFGRHRLTDVLEEDGEEDQTGRISWNGSVNRKRYSSSSPASSMDALWELHSHRLSEAGLSRHSDSSAILTEDTDDFIIGQRVWVGGNKPGHIAFIGDTTFAPGEWAGIALDEPIGKNDGSVGGTRYFMCEPKKGVFCRLTRLTRSPLNNYGNSSDDYNTPSHTGSHKMLAMSPSPTDSHRSMLKSPASLFGSNTSLSSAHVDYKLGDRVIIKSGQGSKVGTVRYIGLTEFAKGEWVGVELDEPRGKNDGAVNGIRYFDCQPRFGLFSPISKVSKSPSNVKPNHCQIHSPTGGLPPSGIRRSTSKESLVSNLSMLSSASTAPRRVRLGITSLAPKKLPATSSATPRTVAARTAWQEVLEEKQQHIEQLLKEKDLDRAEVTRAASQAEEAERKLLLLTQEYTKYREECGVQLQKHLRLLNELKENRKELESQLEDEKKKNEDWQFKYEEAEVTRADIQARSEIKSKEFDGLILENEKLTLKVREKLEKLHEDLKNAKDAEINREKVINNLQTQIQTAQKDLEAVKRERDELHNSLELNKSEVDSLKKELSDTVAARDKSLQTQIQTAQMELEAVKQERDELHKSLELNKSEVISLKKELSDIVAARDKSLQTAQMDLEAVKLERDELHKSLELNKSEVDSLKKELSDTVAARDKSSNTQIQTAQMELETVKQERDELHKSLELNKSEVDSLKKELSDIVAARDKSSNTQIQTAQTDLETVKQERDELHKSLELIKSEVDSLKKELSDTIAARDKSLAENAGEFEEKLETIKNLNNVLIQQKEEFKHFVDKLSQQYEETLNEKSSTILEINTVIANKDENINQLNIKISELESNIIDKNAEFEKLKSEMEHVVEKGKADAEIIGNLNAENKNNNLSVVETNLRQELDNVKLQLQNATEKLNIKTAETGNIIQEKNSIISKLEANIDELKKVKLELNSELSNLVAERDGLRNVAQNLREELDQANIALAEKIKLVVENDAAIIQLKENQKKLNEKIENCEEDLKTKSETIDRITEELYQRNNEIIANNEETRQRNDELIARAEEIRELTRQVSKKESRMEEDMKAMAADIERSRTKSSELRKQLHQIKSEKELLNLEVQESSTQVNQLEKKVSEKDELIKSLTEKVKANRELVLKEQNEKMKAVESVFENTIEEINRNWEANVKDLQAEIDILKDRLSKTMETPPIAIAGTSGDVIKPEDTLEYQKLLNAKAISDAQLEFVNSIIVDMLKKNEEHQIKIDLLEQGYSPSEVGLKIRGKQVAPRKYCDICQEFDLHETEDCSKQESDEPPSNAQLGKPKKEKPPPRPYCTICEEFGHDTADCTVSQEF